MAESLKITITADNSQAVPKIEETTVATDKMGAAFDKIPKASNQAGLALNNLSRIAQDAPYGFIGISNNINPMLESFQRLKETTGSTGSALKAMVSSLMGPAGLGLAVGAVSSLLVVFGDKLFKASDGQKDATDKTKEHTEALKAEKSAIDQIYTSTANEATQVFSLIAILNSETETRKRKLDALEKLKKINPEIFDGLRLEGNIVIGLTAAYNNYIQNLELVIAAKNKQQEIEKLTEEILKRKGILDSEEDKQIKETGNSLKTALDAKKTDEQLRKESLQTQIKQNKEEREYNDLITRREKALKSLIEFSKGIKVDDIAKPLKKTKTPVKLISDGVYDASLETKFQEETRNLEFESKIPSAANIGKGSLFGMFDENYKGKINTTKNELTEFLKSVKEGFKQANSEAHQFANTMAGGITNSLQGAFDALMRGENVFEALSKSVLQFAEDLTFAIIKAQILAAIQESIAVSGTGAAGAAAGGGGFFNILMNLLGFGVPQHAAGGITNGPSIGMIGEAGPEAIMPLSKLSSFLNTTFNAGAMSSNSSNGSGQFVLRGQDLLLAVNRSQKASNLKGQSISLA